jgi:hypothetical protein
LRIAFDFHSYNNDSGAKRQPLYLDAVSGLGGSPEVLPTFAARNAYRVIESQCPVIRVS